MTKEHEIIIKLISKFLTEHPEQRFGEALLNLRINEFREENFIQNSKYNIRNSFSDKDSEIIDRMEKQLEWFLLQKKVNLGISAVDGLQRMTIKERLLVTDLFDSFEKYKLSNKDYARFILKSLEVDYETIKEILQ